MIKLIHFIYTGHARLKIIIDKSDQRKIYQLFYYNIN